MGVGSLLPLFPASLVNFQFWCHLGQRGEDEAWTMQKLEKQERWCCALENSSSSNSFFFMKPLCGFFEGPLISHPHRTPTCGGLFTRDAFPLVHNLLLSWTQESGIIFRFFFPGSPHVSGQPHWTEPKIIPFKLFSSFWSMGSTLGSFALYNKPNPNRRTTFSFSPQYKLLKHFQHPILFKWANILLQCKKHKKNQANIVLKCKKPCIFEVLGIVSLKIFLRRLEVRGKYSSQYFGMGLTTSVYLRKFVFKPKNNFWQCF